MIKLGKEFFFALARYCEKTAEGINRVIVPPQHRRYICTEIFDDRNKTIFLFSPLEIEEDETEFLRDVREGRIL